MAAALGVVFALDRVSGLAPVQHLYYIPIILASVRFGYRGSATAAVAILLYHLANPRVITFRYTEGDVVQIALFVGIGVAAARLANDRRRLHRLAITDDLTGLHNLRSFEAQLRTLLRRAVVYQLPVALRSDVNAFAPVLAGVPFPAGTLSISIGVASTAGPSAPAPSQDGDDRAHDDAAREALFRAADAALYAAKTGGRNRVAVAGPAHVSEDTPV